ncbi:unnamed protein product [Symbiodinium sp. CCMP2592]|nr:unnamed protein product [Symbiodinium sp. CCMP2592]
MQALTGIHAVTETKADRMTQIRMDQELNALNEMNGPGKAVQVLWGKPVGETRSRATRLTGGGPKVDEWRNKCRLETYKITLQSGKRTSNDLGLVFLHVFVVYGVYGDAAATNSILEAVAEWTQTLGDQMPTFIVGDFNAETSERIDMIWMNEVALLSFADFATTWDFATHQLPMLNFLFVRTCGCSTKIRFADQIRVRKKPSTWTLWSERCERHLVRAAGVSWHDRFRQRGRLQKVLPTFATPQVRRHDLEHFMVPRHDATLHRLEHARRRIRALGKMPHPGPQKHATWEAARRDLQRLQKRMGDHLFLETRLPTVETLSFYAQWLDKQAALLHSRAHAQATRRARDRRRQYATRYVTKSFQERATHVNGSCDTLHVDQQVRQFWTDVWTPTTECNMGLQTALLSLPLPRFEVELPPLQPSDLRRYLSKAKGVAGPCGWRHTELRKLPDSLLQQLIDIFMLMEQHGTTLSVNCQGDISLIPKKANCFEVDTLRPITVLSYLHRMYAGARLRAGLLQWQEAVLGELPLRANRPSQRTHDLTLTASVTMEHMRHQQQSISAVSYDLSKAFNSMPFHADNINGFGWMVLKRLGFDPRVTAVMFDQYRRLQRRFKTLQHLGRPVAATGLRGIVQGCAISMIFCNCITTVWEVLQRSGLRLPRALQLQVASHPSWPCDQTFAHDDVELGLPDTTTLQGGYADDLHVISGSAPIFRRAHVLTVLWAIVCDVRLNVRKTVVFGAIVQSWILDPPY